VNEPQPTTARAAGAPAGGQRAGIWSAVGAVFAALLASACCWVPLLLIAVGGASAGVASLLETYRVWFAIASVAMLGLGFYFVYLRRRPCDDDGCAPKSRRSRRISAVILWASTPLVVAMIAFPGLIGEIAGGAASASVGAANEEEAQVYSVEGMTCGGCAASIALTLRGVPGVAAAEVSYDEGRATVQPELGGTVTDAAVVAALEAMGYRAARLRD